jgi:hypothetical protein
VILISASKGVGRGEETRKVIFHPTPDSLFYHFFI